MKHTFAFALILGLVACGDKAQVAAVSDTPAPKLVSAEVVKSDPDKELAQRVGRAIDDARLQGIEVAAADGVVTLWGTTLSAKERSRAAEIATNVEGVKAVDNRLEVVAGS